jgi:ribose transport system substrate-binding protein
MMKCRIGIPAALLAAVGLAVFGCGSNGPDSDGSGPAAGGRAGVEKLTVAVIPKSTGGEFWETVEQGARDAGRDLGVTIKWEGPLAETEMAEQNKIIENMITLGVDGMALAPLNNRAMRKPVENVVEAGIPVVIFDSGIDGDAHVSYVATDNEAGGVLAAEQMAKMLGHSKRVFVLRYIQGTASTEQRAKGFIAAIKAAGKDVLGEPYTDDATVTGAKNTATNSLEGFVTDGKLELDGIFVTNLYSTLGMVGALEDLRKSGVEVDIVFIGFDTSEKLIDELQQGNIDALVSQNPHKIGYLAVETLVKHLRGEPIEPLVDTGVEFVTRERLENEPAIRKLVGSEE